MKLGRAAMRVIGQAVPLIVLSGCVVGSAGHGGEWVGKPATALVSKQGAPERSMTLPSGTLVYVYTRRNLEGNSLCDEDYFVAGQQVVGFSEHGVAINCSAKVGKTE